MLRRTVSSLSGRAASLLRRQPVTTAATVIRRHPETHIGAIDARGYRRMARRIPPARPDGYSTSDGEADACRDEQHPEPAAGADGEEEEEVDWDGFTLDLKKGTIEEAFEDDEEEEEEEGEK